MAIEPADKSIPAPDPIEDYRYLRTGDRIIDDVEFFVLDAYPKTETIERDTGYALRRRFGKKKDKGEETS